MTKRPSKSANKLVETATESGSAAPAREKPLRPKDLAAAVLMGTLVPSPVQVKALAEAVLKKAKPAKALMDKLKKAKKAKKSKSKTSKEDATKAKTQTGEILLSNTTTKAKPGVRKSSAKEPKAKLPKLRVG